MARRAGSPKTKQAPAPDASYRAGAVIGSEADLAAALEALQAIDPVFVSRVLGAGARPELRRRPAGLEGLAAIVVAQQVSTASAAAIFGRLKAALDPFDAEALHVADDALLRRCGLSIQKMRALRAIAAAMLDGSLLLETLAERSAEGAVSEMRAVHGIGPWTADAFLLFCLGHPDAWPAGDLALQEAARAALDLPRRPTTAELHALGERWRPFRAVAARLLWSYYRVIKPGRDGAPVPEGGAARA